MHIVRIFAVAVGGAAFLALMVGQRFAIKSCPELQQMYAPMIHVGCP